jgi:hypothetical protein
MSAVYASAVTDGLKLALFGLHRGSSADPQLAELRQAAGQHGRPAGLGELEITITPPGGPVDLETARRYADLGVHRLAIQPETMDGSAIDELIAHTGNTLTGRV